MIENTVPNREKKYKIAVIVLSAALIVMTGLCLWEYLQPEEPSLIGEFQWFSLLSNYDQAYEQITKTYGDIISEDDLLIYQQGDPHNSLIYPVLLCRNAETGTVFVFRFYEDPRSGDLILHKVKALSDPLSQELTDTLFIQPEE